MEVRICLTFFDPVGTAEEIIRSVLDAWASDLITSGFKYMSQYIATPTDFSQIPHFDDLMLGTQVIGSSLVILFLYLRLLSAYRDLVTEESEVNYAEIVGSAAISMGACLVVQTVYDYVYLSNHKPIYHLDRRF
ncbi:hypothetical protein GCM10020331_012580 [Ectobacillus funiculus]